MFDRTTTWMRYEICSRLIWYLMVWGRSAGSGFSKQIRKRREHKPCIWIGGKVIFRVPHPRSWSATVGTDQEWSNLGGTWKGFKTYARSILWTSFVSVTMTNLMRTIRLGYWAAKRGIVRQRLRLLRDKRSTIPLRILSRYTSNTVMECFVVLSASCFSVNCIVSSSCNPCLYSCHLAVANALVTV